MIKALTFLLLASTCFGQVTMQQMQPFFNGARPPSGPPGPNTIANLRYWWHSGDMTTNTAVTNWIDEIQGSIWTNGAATLQPTNSALGVGFNTARWLSNTVPFFMITDGTKKTGSVYMVISPTAAPAAFGAILADNTGGGQALYTRAGSLFSEFLGGGSGNIASFANNVVYDWAYVVTNSTVGQGLNYTNNVFINVAAANGDWPNGVMFMGKDGGGAHQYTGFIRDVLFYYQALSAANISTLHTYFTNLYTFSP